MKKVFLFILFFIIISVFGGKQSEAKQSDFYYNKSNAPVFYGATKITLSKNSIDEFDPLDARFRIFAKDFEDGDLTNNIEILENNVSLNPGEYHIKYRVIDSHNNEKVLTVPVKINDDQNQTFLITRTMYTTPSCWNMSIAGFSRCNTGDRQILGLYLPENEKFDIRVVNGPSMSIAFLNNDSYNESSMSINNDGTFMEVFNNKNYSSVPLITTPILERYSDISTTYEIELRYNNNSKKLDYYHYLDDEQAFFSAWDLSTNECSVIENEVMTLVVPYADRHKLVNHNYYNNGFLTLDSHLEYYQKVVDKMDELVGLSLNPSNATDQNVRTKYLIKANAHGAGAAYYAGNHVGINSPSISAFFQMNWGGLHELAHGYQGYLGKGYMGLGEVSNNILGYYIQQNKNIYYYEGNWLGEISKIEQSKNDKRSNNEYQELDDSTKLYMLINLFDSFEGETTYKKLFQYYRNLLASSNIDGSTYKYTNADIYAMFFKDEYDANIIPYLNDWKLSISEDIVDDVFSSASKTYSIFKDAVDDTTFNKIKNNENISLSYGLLDSSLLQKYEVKSSLAIDIDNYNVVLGKKIKLCGANGFVKYALINNEKIDISDLPAGAYNIIFPKDFQTEIKDVAIYLKEGENSIHVSYNDIEPFYHETSLRIRGVYETYGFRLDLKDSNTKAVLSLGAANLGNQTEYYRNHPDELFISVTIKNQNNEVIYTREIKGNEYFALSTQTIQTIDIESGYAVDIFTKCPGYVGVYSNINNTRMEGFNSNAANQKYIITNEGFTRDDVDSSKIMYDEIKPMFINTINEYIDYVSNKPDELSNKNINSKMKLEVVRCYSNLSAADQSEFTDIINKIMKGGAPTIEGVSQIEIKKGEIPDIYGGLSVYDNEDGQIILNEDNASVDIDITSLDVGIHLAKVTVVDSDNNESTLNVYINVTEELVNNSKEPNYFVYIIVGIGVALVAGGILFFVIKRKKA